MLYLVLAHDGTDPEAPERRRRVRPRHLEELQPRVAEGRVALGGAILDKAGAMVGSAMLIEAEDLAAAHAFIEQDIYTREGVWQSFDVYPFKRAV